MKLATFTRGGRTSIGVVDTARGQVLDLAEASRVVSGEAYSCFASMLALIDSAGPGLERARKLAAQWPTGAALALDSVRLLAPIPEPRQMRNCLTFELHLRNAMPRPRSAAASSGRSRRCGTSSRSTTRPTASAS